MMDQFRYRGYRAELRSVYFIAVYFMNDLHTVEIFIVILNYQVQVQLALRTGVVEI